MATKGNILLVFIYLYSFVCGEGAQISSTPLVIQLKDVNQGSQLEEKDPMVIRNISIVENEFMLNNEPFRIMSGSLHYFRLPHQYWRDRLQKIKAAGLNSVSTYVEWSSHEPEEGVNLFKSDNNIAKFIKIAQEEGLYVLLRPGPYICAERDLGGLPYWLLGKYPKIQLRSSDKDFIYETKRWFSLLFSQVKPLLYGNGGPIILVQVENEYGSYGAEKKYLEKVRDIISEHVEGAAVLYTTDGQYRSYFLDGYVNGTLTTIDFGPSADNVTKTFRELRKFMPKGPLMNSEYYPGWLTHWTENLQQVSTARVVKTLNDMLNNNINFNFYMFYGGTNFGFTSGANYGTAYQPDLTSYDYDAPLSEAGDPTPKYNAIRDAISKFNPALKDIPEPSISKKAAYGQINLEPVNGLLSEAGRKSLGHKHNNVTGSKLPTFEELRQFSGLILYETNLNGGDGRLEIAKPRDWILVFVDYTFQGVINRMNKIYSLNVKSKPGSVLSLLVENQGRINYGRKLHDYKGILSPVIFNNKELDGEWSITGYKLDIKDESTLKNSDDISKPQNNMKGTIFLEKDVILYRAKLTLADENKPLDTFIDMTGWGKGYVFVNGYNLGRYWPQVGPQITLYVPGVWLKSAPEQNTIHVLELDQAPTNLTINFIDYPILNRTAPVDIRTRFNVQ